MSLLTEVDDAELLQQMLKKCLEMVQKADTLDDLPPEVIAALEKADNDNDLSDTIPNEAAFKMYREWQKP